MSAKYLTGWGRTIAIFVTNTKKFLLETDLPRKKLEVKHDEPVRIAPVKQQLNTGAKYNADVFKKLLDSPRFYFVNVLSSLLFFFFKVKLEIDALFRDKYSSKLIFVLL